MACKSLKTRLGPGLNTEIESQRRGHERLMLQVQRIAENMQKAVWDVSG